MAGGGRGEQAGLSAVAREVEPTVAKLPDWVLVQGLAHPLQPTTVSGSIGSGEREVISLGLELGSALLILDEQPARRLATSLGLRVIGTVGILMAARSAVSWPRSGRRWTGCWQSGSSWIKISTIGSSPRLGSNSEDPAGRREGAWRPPRRSFMPKSAGDRKSVG